MLAPKGYSYVRYSSARQSLGDSKRRQLDDTKAWAAELGIEIDETLVDEGTSAYHAIHKKKGHWGTFVARVDAGQIAVGSTIFVEALDRMSREKPRIALNGFLDLVNAGIEIRTTMDRQHFTAASIDQNDGQLHMTIGLMRGAHQESANKARRVKDAHATNRGKPTDVCPAWIRQNSKSEIGFEIIPGYQPVIDLIFQRCIDGWGLNRIAAYLNETGVPTFASRKRISTGWYDIYIRTIVKQRLIRGEVVYHEIKEGKRKPLGQAVKQYPEAVSEATWQAANDALAARRQTGGRHIARLVNLFQGLAVCQCGAKMLVQVRRKIGRRDNIYLLCGDAKRRVCSNRRYYTYRPIEQQILATFGTTAYQVADQSAAQIAMSEQIAVAKHEADQLKLEATEAFRIARRNPSDFAEASANEAAAEHAAKAKQVAELEAGYRRVASEPMDEQIARIRALIAKMDDLTGDQSDELRTKLNADFKRIFHRIVFKSDGNVAVRIGSGSPTTETRTLTLRRPSRDSVELRTVEAVMQALRDGHSVGVSS